jgi:hypothetical protein
VHNSTNKKWADRKGVTVGKVVGSQELKRPEGCFPFLNPDSLSVGSRFPGEMMYSGLNCPTTLKPERTDYAGLI